MSNHEEQPLAWTLGDRLRKTRVDAQLGTDEMAYLLHQHRNSVSKWERGVSKPPIRKLMAWADVIAEYGDIDVEDVLKFLEVSPEQAAAERRHVERRVTRRAPSRQPRDEIRCSYLAAA